MISERPEQVNYPNKNNDRRYRKAAAIKVPYHESVHKIAEAIHISPGGTSSIRVPDSSRTASYGTGGLGLVEQTGGRRTRDQRINGEGTPWTGHAKDEG
jgi:hypothetical protein